MLRQKSVCCAGSFDLWFQVVNRASVTVLPPSFPTASSRVVKFPRNI